jgi:hypothetical protein
MSIANVELVCDGCAKSIAFPVSAVGTVQECPHCGGYVDVELPDEVQPKSVDDDYKSESDRQWKESGRQLEVAKQHQEETARQLEKTTLLQNQVEDAIQHFTRFLNRCEQLAERVENVLKKWEGRNTA